MSDGGVPVITFLSDYGPWDEFVGVCHAVIARRAPRARIIDLGHGIARQDVRSAAVALRAVLPYTPVGVHLAVVDPGVGSGRRAVALRVGDDGRTMVGPDNGLLTLAAEQLGGVEPRQDAVALANGRAHGFDDWTDSQDAAPAATEVRTPPPSTRRSRSVAATAPRSPRRWPTASRSMRWESRWPSASWSR